MAEIDGNAEVVHAADCLAAYVGETTSVGRHHASRERRLVIVGKLHHADAEVAEDINVRYLSFQHVNALEGEDNAQLVFRLRALEVVGDTDLEQDPRVHLEHLLQVRDLFNRVD